jgi:hypothetical protein
VQFLKIIFYTNLVLTITIRINLPLFSTVLPSNSRLFLSCRSFVVITTFSTSLVEPVDLLLDGRAVENKGKLILTEIFPSVQKHDI